MHLYQICRIERQLGIPIYEFTVDAKLDYQIWFHFAKIDPTVINAGLCVFNVSINGLTVVDVCECLDFKVRFGSKGWRTGFGRKQFWKNLRFRRFETFAKDALLVRGVFPRTAFLPRRWRLNGRGNFNNSPAITIASALLNWLQSCFLKSLMDLLKFNLNLMESMSYPVARTYILQAMSLSIETFYFLFDVVSTASLVIESCITSSRGWSVSTCYLCRCSSSTSSYYHLKWGFKSL